MERIAEDQHVLTPRVDQNGKLNLARVGVNEASTFSGFCSFHELLFSGFESKREITNVRQAALQAFRTLCREIARTKWNISSMEQTLDEFRKFRYSFYKKGIQDAAPNTVVESLEVEGWNVEERVTQYIDNAKDNLTQFKTELYSELFQYINDGSVEPCLNVLTLPLDVPVALSGFGVISYINNEKHDNAPILVGIVPQNDETLTFLCAAQRHCEVVNALSAKMETGFGSVNSLESWMLYGSDHWFIRPSAWHAIPQERQERILEAIMSDEHDISEYPKFSVLDATRRFVLNYLINDLDGSEDATSPIVAMIYEETNKLLPQNL